MSGFDEQVCALGAWALAVHAVRDIAERGQDVRGALPALMPCLLRFDQGNIRDYFQCGTPLNEGLRLLGESFGRDGNVDAVKCGMQVLFLEKKLSKNRELMHTLVVRLRSLQRQAEHFSPEHDNITAQAASIYQDTVSKISPRIMVSGNPQYLQQNHFVEQIRALLLCAMRAAALWRAEGGSRWQLMLSQRGVAERAAALYREGALR